MMSEKEKERVLKSIGSKVKLRREEMGLTQEDFAKKYGYARTTLAKLEAGLRDFKSTEILTLAEQLNVSCDYLLGRVRAVAPDDFIQEIDKRYGLPETALDELSDTSTKDSQDAKGRVQTMSRMADILTYRKMVTLLLTTDKGKKALEKLAGYYFGKQDNRTKENLPTFNIEWNVSGDTYIKSVMLTDELQLESMLELAKKDFQELRLEMEG